MTPPWFGELPVGWRRARIKSLSRIINGSTPRSGEPNFWDGQIVWVTPEDLGKQQGAEIDDSARRITGAGLNSCGTSLVPPGSIIVSTRAPIGHLGIARTHLCTNQGCRSIVPWKESSSKYYYYLLLAARQELSARGRGSTFTELSSSDLGDVPIPFPPLATQKAIADYLNEKTAAIDALIEKKRKLLDLLAEERAALINQVVTKGLNPTVPMKDSGIPWIGEIPAHWEVKRLKHISPAQTVGVVVNPSAYLDDAGDVPFIYGSEVSEGEIRAAEARRISPQSNNLLRKSQLRAGDLACVRVGDPGVTAVVPPELDGINCASIMIVRRAATYSSDWLGYAMNLPAGRQNVWLVAYGAAQKQYNISHAVDFVYAVPPKEEQQNIATWLDSATARNRKMSMKVSSQIDRLQEYRQALITAAVTGQLDIEAAA